MGGDPVIPLPVLCWLAFWETLLRADHIPDATKKVKQAEILVFRRAA